MLVGVLGGPSRLREHDVVADLVIRRAAPDDTPAVLGLLEASMGWVPDSEHAAFFAWKHLENPVGASPAWVAADPDEGDRIVGYRTFLRWEFEADGTVLRAVRAVDTATHPEYQGRGIFSRLTLHALDELQAEGVVAVFNTPNERSLPGYLKMGWRPVGKLAVGLRPRSASAAIRTAGRARLPTSGRCPPVPGWRRPRCSLTRRPSKTCCSERKCPNDSIPA